MMQLGGELHTSDDVHRGGSLSRFSHHAVTVNQLTSIRERCSHLSFHDQHHTITGISNKGVQRFQIA